MPPPSAPRPLQRLGREEPVKYTIVIEAGPTSYGAHVPDLPGCVAAADTRKEVVELHLEGLYKDGEPVPAPRTTAIEMDVPLPAESRVPAAI